MIFDLGLADFFIIEYIYIYMETRNIKICANKNMWDKNLQVHSL